MPGDISMIPPEQLSKGDVIVVGGLAPHTAAAFELIDVQLKPEDNEVHVTGKVINAQGANVNKLPVGSTKLKFNSNSFVATFIENKE